MSLMFVSVPSGYDLAEEFERSPAAKYSYSESKIESVDVTRYLQVFGSDLSKAYPTVIYEVTLKRSTFYYLNFVLFPLVAFTLVSFAVFFMSFEVGERLGFGITLVLVVEVSKQTVSALLPICGELMWIEIFIWVNFLFTTFSLIESCLVLGLCYNTEEFFVDLITPAWFLPLRSFVYGSWLHQRNLWLDAALARMGISMPFPKEKEDPKVALESAVCDHLRKRRERARAALRPTRQGSRDTELSRASRDTQGSRYTERTRDTLPAPMEYMETQEDEAQKLLYFESLFFKMDPDGNGSISFEEAGRLLAFTALDMTAEDRSSRIEEAATDAEKRFGERDRQLNRNEFIGLCIEQLWNTPRAILEMAAENFAEFSRMKDNRTSAKWRRIANNIDRFCRVWVPIIYVCALFILYSLEFEDNYSDDRQQMFSIIGTEEEYRSCPDGGTDCPEARQDWQELEIKKKWFSPTTTVRMSSQLGSLFNYMGILVGFCIAATVAVLLVIGSCWAIRVWSARRYKGAKAVARDIREGIHRFSLENSAPDTKNKRFSMGGRLSTARYTTGVSRVSSGRNRCESSPALIDTSKSPLGARAFSNKTFSASLTPTAEAEV